MSHVWARHAGRSPDASRRWRRSRWLLFRSGACQRLSTFSINSRNSAILAPRFAASRIPGTAAGARRQSPTLALSTSLCQCVLVCGPPSSLDCDTSVPFLRPHKQNRLTSPNSSRVRHFKIASGGFDPGQTYHGTLGRCFVLEQFDLVPTPPIAHQRRRIASVLSTSHRTAPYYGRCQYDAVPGSKHFHGP